MATPRTRRGQRTPANPGLRILRWTWALVLSLAFIVAGLALAGGGALFAYVGGRGALNAEDGGHLVAGALFAVGGVAAAVGGVRMLWRLPRRVERLSGRKPPKLGKDGGGGGYYGGSFFGGDGGCGGDGGGGDGGSC